MGVNIRRARPDDAADIAAIYVHSSNLAFSRFQPDRELTPDLIDRWRQDLVAPESRWWVAEHEGVAVGFAGVRPNRDSTDAHTAELDTIAVAPAWQRRSVGTALMTVVNRQLDADHYQDAILWTWAGYEPAHAFYVSAGWHLTEETRDEGRQVSFRRVCGGDQ